MPPPSHLQIPIVHKITQLYKEVYILGKKIAKRDRFGVHNKIENLCLDILNIGIEAALTTKEEKKPLLRQLRIKIETAKHLIRISHDLNIINYNKYIVLQEKLQEISKMANGWLKYLT